LVLGLYNKLVNTEGIKQKGKELGSAMEKREPTVQNVGAPGTPEKPPPMPARPQPVYVKRFSEHGSQSFLGRIAAEEARDPICAIITTAASTSKNEHPNNCKYLETGAVFQIDLKESIYDWNGNSTASVHGTQIFGDSEGLSEEGFESENHNLLSIPDLEESDRCREKCCVLPCK